MNNIAQMPDTPEFNETAKLATNVIPIATATKPDTKPYTTDLNFPATFNTVAERLNQMGVKCNANTLKSRWMSERILPVFEGLNVPKIKTTKGQITEFGFNAIAETIERCIQGENGMKIAPEKLREEMVERYGLRPVKDSFQVTKDLLERSQQIKKQSDDRAESTALARVEAKSELDILQEAIKNLNTANSDDDDDTYELSPEEKAKLAKKFLAKKVAEREYLQRLAKGEV